MDIDNYSLYSSDLNKCRRLLENQSHLDLIRLTEKVIDLLTPADKMTYDIENYANGYEDHNGRVKYILALLRDKRFDRSRIPLLNPEIKKTQYSRDIDFSYLLPKNREKPVEDYEQPVQTPASKIVYVTNPRWEHKKVGDDSAEDKDEQSEGDASIGDSVILMADIKNCPEGAEVVFDIYDTSVKPPKKIDSTKGKHNNGLGKGEWVVACRSETGDVPQLAFEVTARSKVSSQVTIPLLQKIQCDFVEMPDLLFNHNSAVSCLDSEGVLIGSVAAAFIYTKNSTGREAVLFGHSDTSGDPAYNYDLSGWRAEGIKAIIDNDSETFLDIVDLASKVEDYQTILKSLAGAHGYTCDPGKVDNVAGEKTTEALKIFQSEYNERFNGNLKVDGAIGPKTWTAMFTVIRSLVEEIVKAECGEMPAIEYGFNGKGIYPCGESFPVDEAQKDNYKSKSNRRVEIVFCEQGKAPVMKEPVDKKVVTKSEAVTYDKKRTDKKPIAVVLAPTSQQNVGSNTPLEFVYPVVNDSSKPHKQYVNLQSNSKEKGLELAIRVKPKDIKVDLKKVFWKISAEANNSKRNDPKTGVKKDSSSTLLEFSVGAINLENQIVNGESTILLDCGVCGGDIFTVEVGTDGQNYPLKMTVENWRKIEYEIWQPLANTTDKISDYTSFKSDKSPGLSNVSKDYMKDTLNKVNVVFEENGAFNYKASDIPLNGVHNVLSGDYFNKTSSNKITLLSLDQATQILNTKSKNTANKNVLTMIFADYVGEIDAWVQPISVFKETTFTPKNGYIYKKCIDSYPRLHLNHGDFSIKKLSWRATEYFDFSPSGGTWKPIVAATDPGFAHRNGGVFTTESDISAHIDFEKFNSFKIKLPASHPSYPAAKLPLDTSGQLTDSAGNIIQVEFVVEGCSVNSDFNGAALMGNIWMTTFGGDIHQIGLASVILHELGHNMGQVYADKNTDLTFGRPALKKIPGIGFPKDVSTGGVAYGGHEHQGTHCASGIANKAAVSFQSTIALNQHTCLMYGASDMESTFKYPFCDECKQYIKAEDLSDIRKYWA